MPRIRTVSACVVLCLLLCGCLKPAGKPKAAREGETWTIEELVAHLKRRGEDIETFPGKNGSVFVAVVPMFESDKLAEVKREYTGKDYPWQDAFPGLMLIERLPSAKEAKEGTQDAGWVWSWGRFRFTGNIDSGNGFGGGVRNHID